MSEIGSGLRNLRAWRQVMRDVSLPRPELERLVAKRLKSVLVSAYLHVPYYRDIMESAGYHPLHDYRGPEDLARLPITTKLDLKKRGINAFVREGADLSRCHTDTTSGSTGIPLRVYRDSQEQAIIIAKWLRVLFTNGYSMRDRVMAFTSPAIVDRGRSVLRRVGLLRRLAISFRLPTEALANALIDYQPDVLYGGRTFLDVVALELKRRGIKLQSLKLLVGTGEIMLESSRRLYRQRYGIEVVDSYGSEEMGVMAYETPDRDGLHLCEDLTFFEFLDQEGNPVPPGEPGRPVVTDLTNKLMPFIRYDQGDLAVYDCGESPDGRRPRRLTQILGCDSDIAVLPDGTKRLDQHFVLVLQHYEGIAQFRVVQHTPSLFRISIVADQAYYDSIHGDLIHRLQSEFPPPVHFEVNRQEIIEPDPSGKLRILISEVEA